MGNRLAVWLMFPVGLVGVYAVGADVPDAYAAVAASRTWLLVVLGAFVLNGLASFAVGHVWSVTVGRLLAMGLVAYLSIDACIGELGAHWGALHHLWAQKVDATWAGVRYALVAYVYASVMSVVGVALGFERPAEPDS